ncbi:hypothetical protein HYU13_02245 [Candidatus Woesearchaeota archaeon]|nr:hypothetical protein [Candidatus Woesearchaeota archaeon]
MKKLQLFAGVLMAFLLIASISFSSTGGTAYKRKYCADFCVKCSHEGILKLYDKNASAGYEKCIRATYEQSKKCSDECVKKDITKREGEVMAKECNQCLADPECDYLQGSGLNHGREDCISVDKSRDFVQYRINTMFGRENGCPKGAELEDGSACVCPKGTVMDNMQSVCMDKKAITANLNKIFSSIPDDTLQMIAENMPDDMAAIRSSLTAVISDPTGIARFGLNNVLSQMVYENLFYNSENLRALIRVLGRDKTEKLIALLERLLKGEEPETPQAEQEQKTGEPAQEQEQQNAMEDVPAGSQAGNGPGETQAPTTEPTAAPTEPENPYLVCESGGANCPTSPIGELYPFSCHLISLPNLGYENVCSRQGCTACETNKVECLSLDNMGTQYCVVKKG